MVTAASTTGIRFAPEDPSLPPPWRALVDDNTGYVYYWNTQTGDTTYNRPTVPATPGGVNFAAIGNGVSQPLPENGASANGHANGSNGSMYVTKNAVVEQPKLAAIPIQQITSGALHAPIGAVNGISSGSSFAMGSYKRSADTFDYSDRDAYKRPRTQGVLCSSFDTESYRRQHEITVLGDNVPPPFITFDSVGLSPEVLRELQIAGFTAPTPIQAQSWPVALLGRDIVAIAKTGSGKTLGYLLPAFLHLESRKNNSRMGPTVLVLAPTRELATQIHDEAMKFGRSSRLTSTCVYGGAPKGPQLRDIERGCDIIIATPGRLNDFLEMRKISLRQVSYLVLDEADRMLDMGFEPQIRKIVNEVPSRRQTLMYTATWPKEVRKIAADLLVSPVQVNIGNTDDLSANKAITQCVEVVLPQDKLRRLEQILRNQEPGSKIIIFCSTKRMCDQLARGLRRDFTALAIHGDKSQSERDWVLSQFKSGKSPVLVATDVAARGLDIKDIKAVINYDFPTGVEDYVHRIGRTGRAGASGLAYTFFSEQDAKYGRELIKVLEGANQKVPLELREMAARGGFGKPRGGRWDSGGRGGRGSFGGRGDGGSFGGRGSWGGGRSGNSGAFENGDIVNKEKARYGDREKKRSKSPGRGRSYSRSPTGSRSRSHEKSRGRSRSPHARHQENSYHGGSSWQW